MVKYLKFILITLLLLLSKRINSKEFSYYEKQLRSDILLIENTIKWVKSESIKRDMKIRLDIKKYELMKCRK